MTIQEIQEEIRKNMAEVRVNVENAVNYLTGDEFKARAEETQKKVVDLATSTSQDAVKRAREISEKAVSNAREFQDDVTARARSLFGDLRASATEILSNVRGGKDNNTAA